MISWLPWIKERDQYLQMLASHAGYANNAPTPTKENKHKSRKWYILRKSTVFVIPF